MKSFPTILLLLLCLVGRGQFKTDIPQAGGPLLSVLTQKVNKEVKAGLSMTAKLEGRLKSAKTRRSTPQTVTYFFTPFSQFDLSPLLNRPLLPLCGIVETIGGVASLRSGRERACAVDRLTQARAFAYFLPEKSKSQSGLRTITISPKT